MKKRILCIYVTLLGFVCVQAQEKKHFFSDPTCGIMVSMYAAHNFSGPNPDTTQWTFAPSVNILTKFKTDHHVMLSWQGTHSKSIQFLNGKILPRNWDAYVFYQKSITNMDQYGSVGIQKFLSPTPEIDIVFYLEVGTDFIKTQSTTLGLVFHPQLSLKNIQSDIHKIFRTRAI